MEKQAMINIAKDCLKANPGIDQISVVSDGNAFTSESRAQQHARECGGIHETFTRAEILDDSKNKKPQPGTDSAAASAELIDSDVASMAYNDLLRLSIALNLTTPDNKAVTLREALDSYKATLLNTNKE